jgi:hypothetical protein
MGVCESLVCVRARFLFARALCFSLSVDTLQVMCALDAAWVCVFRVREYVQVCVLD